MNERSPKTVDDGLVLACENDIDNLANTINDLKIVHSCWDCSIFHPGSTKVVNDGRANRKIVI